jgi:hypothetical protein
MHVKRTVFLLALSLLAAWGYTQPISKNQATGKARSLHHDLHGKQSTGKDSDTLFFFDGYYYWVNNNDYSTFQINFEDLDSLVPYNASLGVTTDWEFYYKVLGPGDTLSWVQATSWFNPPGQADDWIEMGPLTIPPEGAALSWKNYNNPQFRDGYRVLVDTLGMSNYTHFTTPAVFSVTDLYSTTSTGIDTNSLFLDPPKSVGIPAAYNGKKVYIAFHHNANDMDVIHFKDLLLAATGNTVVEAGQCRPFVQLYPNPVKDDLFLRSNLPDLTPVSFTLTDHIGRQLLHVDDVFQTTGNTSARVDLSQLKTGLYIYRLQAEKLNQTGKVLLIR